MVGTAREELRICVKVWTTQNLVKIARWGHPFEGRGNL